MPSYEQRFYRENPGVLERLTRNLRLLAYLLAGLLAWFTTGRRVRHAYLKAQDSNAAIKLEEYVPAEGGE